MALQSGIMPAFYSLPFIKMQATGNDLIFLDGEALLNSAARPLLSQWPAIVPILSKLLCSRRFSIGADGLILAMPLHIPELADLSKSWYGSMNKDCQIAWTYNNSDGSTSNMCGNGLRCLGLWANKEKDLEGRFKVATALGPLDINFQNENNITVSLGAPRLRAGDIPFVSDQATSENVINKQFKFADQQFSITCVNVGNPHCVIFEAGFLKPELFSNKFKSMSDGFFPEQLKSIAGGIEIDHRFPERTNVEFVRVINRQHIEVLVWERGCGPTLSCGSGQWLLPLPAF